MIKPKKIIMATIIAISCCIYANSASALTALEIEVVHVGLNSIDTLPDYIPPSEALDGVLVNVQVNGGSSEGDELIEPGSVILNWQVNSQEANIFMITMAQLILLSTQEYHYIKRIEAYGNGTKIYWWVTAQHIDGEISSTSVDSFLVGTLALEDEPLPSTFKILGNYPNPFNPKTNINFSVEYAAEVDLSIYSLSGKLVCQLQLGALASGSQSIAWEGKDNFGNDVPSGVYIYRLQSESHSEARKMTLLK